MMVKQKRHKEGIFGDKWEGWIVGSLRQIFWVAVSPKDLDAVGGGIVGDMEREVHCKYGVLVHGVVIFAEKENIELKFAVGK